LFLLLGLCRPAHAVLKEANLDNTLSILRQELTYYYQDQQEQAESSKLMRQMVFQELMSIVRRSNQNALMLYSQKSDYVFDLTYACHEATEMYHNFRRMLLPFRNIVDKYENEIARYDSLVTSLNTMSTRMLSEKAAIDRTVCLALAVNIKRTLEENRQSISDYIHYYHDTEERLKNLNDYASKRYYEIQNNIFINGGDNYFKILSQLGARLSQTKDAVSEKYEPYRHVRSQWDSRVIVLLFIIVIGYALLAIAINFVVLRFLLPKRLRTDTFMAKRTCIALASTVVTFAIILFIARLTTNHNFIIMASGLLMQYAWLLGVILISLLLRVDSTQIKSAFRIYMPLVIVGFIVITFRVVLIPNDLVNMVFPPILLVCTLWQWSVIRRHNKNIPRSDMFYSYISLLVFVVALVSSWSGYTLLSVQLLIWWIMQLTCILTITCVRQWVDAYGKRHDMDNKPITKSWFYHLLYRVLLPTMGVLSIIIAIYWAADVFNLSDVTWRVFTYQFIKTKNFSVSFLNIAMVVILWFVFSFISKASKAFLHHYFVQKDPKTADSRMMMAKNVLQVLIWGIWLLVSLGLCHISFTWLVYVSGGLSAGLGFASKDILENIYYGISLMAGRIKIGDWIMVDGVRGKVSSISYVSTTVDAIDGSQISFQNSQLFTKNYKNMTRNHGYELDILEVGVAYGTDIAKCKQLIIDAVSKLDCVNKKRGVRVVLREFGDSSINLKVLAWVPVATQYSNDGEILEAVYNTLNANNINIPFPQRDLHIIREN
jgi:small-conductance mechanosensitive channel